MLCCLVGASQTWLMLRWPNSTCVFAQLEGSYWQEKAHHVGQQGEEHDSQGFSYLDLLPTQKQIQSRLSYWR